MSLQNESELEVKCTCPSDPESPIKRVWKEDEINKVKYCPKHGSTKESELKRIVEEIYSGDFYEKYPFQEDAEDLIRGLVDTEVSNREKEIAEEVEKYGSRSGMGDIFYETIDKVLSILKH